MEISHSQELQMDQEIDFLFYSLLKNIGPRYIIPKHNGISYQQEKVARIFVL
jgi:hypothetical protein